MPKPPLAVAIAAILLRLAILPLLAASAFLWLAEFSGLAGRILQRLPVPDLPGIQLIFATVLALAACLWLWITAAALTQLRPWARPSALALAFCALALGIWLLGGLSLPSLSSVSISRHLRLLYGVFGLAYAALALLGLAGLIYFNLRSTRTCFRPDHASSPI